MSRLPRWWKQAAAAALTLAAAWFLFATIRRNWAQVRGYPWHTDSLLLAASVVALVAVLAWGVVVWSLVLRRFEHAPVRVGTLQRIWFLSNLARYIPGSVFQFVTAAQLSRSAGLSPVVLLTSLLVHTALSLLSAVVISAWTLTGGLFPALPALWIGVAATVTAVLMVHPNLLNGILSLIPRLLKKQVIRWNGSWGYGIALLAAALLSWAMYGAAYALFVRALTPIGTDAVPVLTGVNALSFVAGFLTPLPGGIGVRETAMTALLHPVLPAGVAGVVSVAARLWNVAGELIGGVLAMLLWRGTAAVDPTSDAAAVPAEPAATGDARDVMR
ncbi:MAG TPA: lysylphosphatidylglycerol synthase domain-containing protein [Longimicrobium sp.]|nr:lysylphosphatidylglycerol synthase domain-containing protein [Longimicrobium sp.]